MNQCWEKVLFKLTGILSVPPPAVVELIRQKNIKVLSSFDSIDGEPSTPTGIALLCNLVDYLQPPSKYSINSYGVGIGKPEIPIPQFVRVYKITSFEDSSISDTNKLVQSVRRYLFKKHGLMTKHPKIYLILWRNSELRELTTFPIKLSIRKKIELDFLFKQSCL